MISFYRYRKNYLLLLSTCAYTIGICLHPLERFSGTVFQVALAGVITIVIVLKVFTPRFSTLLIVVLIFLFWGTIQGSQNSRNVVDESHISIIAKDQQRISVVGTMTRMVSEFRDTSRAEIVVRFIRTEAEQEFKKATGKLLLIVKGSWPEGILPGNSIIVQATARIPPAAAAPGAFDYRKYLAGKKIYLTALVASPILVQPVDHIQATWSQRLFYALERTRSRIARYIDNTLSPATAALYKALIVGNRSSVAPEVLENLKRAGLLHLWAISGMHLGLLTVITYSSLYWLLRRSEKLLLRVNVKKLALLLTLPLLLFYSMLAGFQPPAVRAFIMTSCLVISLGCDRLHSTITTLAGAALTILLVDPLAIQSASFQLSFSAVAAIVLISPKILSLLGCSNSKSRKAIDKVYYLLVSLMAVTISATLGTLPLLLYHFNRLSLVTLPANLLVQPVICFFSLPLGLLSLPFILFYPPAADLLLHFGALGLILANSVSAIISAPESTQLWLPSPHPLLIIFYYLILLSLVDKRLSPLTSGAGSVGLVVVMISFLAHSNQPILFGPQQTRVSFLAVGHGSATLIEFKNGRVVLIDGGARSAPGFDCGARIIAPYLWHSNIRKVDDIIITHEDADHYNGIFTVIKRFKPDRLWLPALGREKHGFSRLIDLARNLDVKIETPKPGVIIDDGESQISVMAGNVADVSNNEDDRGLVLSLSSGNTSVLFPGDITRKREIEMVRIGEHLKSTILLSPHHGSATSNSFAFLSAVSPEILVFSSGSVGEFPSIETLVTAKKLGIPTLNTSEHGTIVIAIKNDGSGYQLTTSKEPRDSYWRNG